MIRLPPRSTLLYSSAASDVYKRQVDMSSDVHLTDRQRSRPQCTPAYQGVPMRIGYIVGSLSSTSINRKFARAFVALAPEGIELVELNYKELPVYSPDVDGDYPQAALDWKSSIESVDGIIILTPEYLRSIPGALKNA